MTWFALLVPALLGADAVATQASEPWLEAPFAATAAEIATAARQIDAAGADAVMLFRDDRFSFDVEGRMTHTRRWVYRISSPEGLENWSATEAIWAPWHQARPLLRVRIINPDSGERWLEPQRVSELSAEQAGLDGQLRLLRAALPTSLGAVVEEQVVLRDERPFFAAGVSVEHLLAMPVPVFRGRLMLEAPNALPLRYSAHLISLSSRRETTATHTELTFDYSDLAAAQPIEAGLPAEEPRYPAFAFSTGESWSSVATAYSRAVSEQLTESETAAVRRWLPDQGSSTRIGRIEDVLEGLRGNTRYQASRFGTSPILPSSPLATLRRGGGDSRELATVLTAALRAENIPAYVALLRAGYGKDVESGLPGLGGFNHALVYVAPRTRQEAREEPETPASGDPIWIDPGDAFSRAGELASDRQGRLALIASPETRQLIRTPEASAADNRTITEIDVFMAEVGPARVIETSTHFGTAEHRQRLLSSQVNESGRRLGYQAYLEAAYRAETLGEVEETPVTDLSVPFRLRLEGLQAGRAWTTAEEGALAIDLRDLITRLPRELLVAGDQRRQRDFVFHEPFIAEWRYRIHPPAQMKPRDLPGNRSWPLGSGLLTRKLRVEGSVVYADFRLDSGPRRISADDFHAYLEAVQEQLRQPPLILWFRPKGRTSGSTLGPIPPLRSSFTLRANASWPEFHLNTEPTLKTQHFEIRSSSSAGSTGSEQPRRIIDRAPPGSDPPARAAAASSRDGAPSDRARQGSWDDSPPSFRRRKAVPAPRQQRRDAGGMAARRPGAVSGFRGNVL